MMKTFYLTVVVALGLVLGLWWTRDTAPPNDAASPSVTPPTASERRQRHRLAGFPGLRPTLPVKTLEPTDNDPEIRTHQEALWRDLRSFASDEKLTDGQWEQFERDLSELAATESAAWAQGVRTDFDGIIELSQELEAELLERCAAYLTKDQLAGLRFRFLGLVTRVRRLHYVPSVTPET